MANWTNAPDDPNRHLIVLSAPHQRHPKYRRHFEAIIDFDIRLARAIMGHDNVIVLARPQEMPFLRGALPDDVLLPADVSDIWIRDFAPVLTTKMVQFVYRPRYLKKWEADEARESFARFCRRYGLEFEKSKLVLDGGNLVSNYKDMAVVTERVLSDNPDCTREEIVAELKGKLALEHVAIIPEVPADVTGHADGMATWTDDNTLALQLPSQQLADRVTRCIKASLAMSRARLVLLPAPSSPTAPKTRFATAHGLYVNAIVTPTRLVVPTYNQLTDNAILKIIRASAPRALVPFSDNCIGALGGSVRCLTWQLAGSRQTSLVLAARKS